MKNSMTAVTASDRFVKKNIGGSPTGERVEAPQALICTVTLTLGLESTPPPGAQIDGDSGGQKIIGRVEPPTPPANRTLVTADDLCGLSVSVCE